jgi:2,3-bisphosphoglycerate-independent phosphoglycerate mutase
MEKKKLNKKKVVLIIMDGWGIAPPDKFNAIDNAYTPNFERLIREYPNTSLRSDGEFVGLPEGQFGTSEINHLTIGSGRIIWQELPKINRAIQNGSFFLNQVLIDAINHVEKNNSRLHLTGIISDGGVHSHIDHLFAILEMLSRQEFKKEVFIHAFADGRDVAPKSVEKYFSLLDQEIKKYPKLSIKLATLQGRVFLDRDRDWARTDMAFDLINKAKGNELQDWQSAMNLEYNRNVTDEYFDQYVFTQEGKIKTGDAIVCFHYRTDRQYQLIKRILQEKVKDLMVCSFVRASEEFEEVRIAFPRDKVDMTLAQILSDKMLSQLHVTETEKFAHLTYFLNGERETEFPQEEWKMFESNRFVKPRYQYEPSMRNFQIADKIIEGIKDEKYDFIIANFSSPDMVGHTGKYEAAVVSAESVDFCIGKIYESLSEKLDKYALIITADHGNSDVMWDYENNQPHTQHTLSKVPFILVSDYKGKLKRSESLSDIAPTVLDLMQIEKPEVMTGESLLENN